MRFKYSWMAETKSNIYILFCGIQQVFSLTSLWWICEFDFNAWSLDLKGEKFLNECGLMFSLDTHFSEKTLIDSTEVYNCKNYRFVYY